jgi:hypothetical protein
MGFYGFGTILNIKELSRMIKPYSILLVVSLFSAAFAQSDTIEVIGDKSNTFHAYYENHSMRLYYDFFGTSIKLGDQTIKLSELKKQLPPLIEGKDLALSEYNHYRKNMSRFWIGYFSGISIMALSIPGVLIEKGTRYSSMLIPLGFIVMAGSITFEIKARNNLNRLVWRYNQYISKGYFRSEN